MRDIEIERPAVNVVLANQPGLISLIDRSLQMLPLPDEFAADIDVTRMRAHGETRQQAALDEQMRIVPHDLAILAGAGLRLVGIDDEIAGTPVGVVLRHERPLHAGRESRAATAAQAGRLHLVDDPVAALLDDSLGAVPGPAAARTFEPPVIEAVEIAEDTILVLEHHVLPFLVAPAALPWPASVRTRGPPAGAAN